jgi:hypothetical protein
MNKVLQYLPTDLKDKKVGVVLISKDGFYLGEKGQLPSRPSFDKEFITYLATDKKILCSENTITTIPPSIKKVCTGLTTDINSDWEVNFGINTFKEKCDYFIIIISSENLGGGKKFNIDRMDDLYTKKKTDFVEFSDGVCMKVYF